MPRVSEQHLRAQVRFEFEQQIFSTIFAACHSKNKWCFDMEGKKGVRRITSPALGLLPLKTDALLDLFIMSTVNSRWRVRTRLDDGWHDALAGELLAIEDAHQEIPRSTFTCAAVITHRFC